jgi:IS5 family transposase
VRTKPCPYKIQGKEAKLSYAGHVLMENRHGLAVNGCVTQATGRAEPQAALAMVEKISGLRRVTLGADKGYDRAELVQGLRDHCVTPHFARKQTSVIDARTTRHPGYAIISASANGWRKFSAGSRPSAGCARLASAESHALGGCSPSPWQPTTWSGCAIWPRPDRAHSE